MLFPLRTDCPLRSTPYVNYALILANIVVFLLQKLGDGHAVPFSYHGFVLSPDSPKLLHFVTYAFLHAGWAHLAGNMLFLYIFGNNVSDKMGQWAYLAFYIAGGVFAGIGYVVTAAPHAGLLGTPPVLGASGAIAAVTGAYMVLFPRSNVTVVYFLFFVGTAEVPGLIFVVFFFALDVVLPTIGDSGVAHTAHISGSLFGVAVSLALLAARVIDRDQWDLLAYAQRWNRRRQFRQAVATGWDPYAPKPGTPRSGRSAALPPHDPRAQKIMELRAQVAEALAHRNVPSAAEFYRQLQAVDPAQVLSRTNQLDIGNHFAETGSYREAADAYELFLAAYPQAEQHAHIELLTGLLHGRYLNDPARALAKIESCLPRLSAARDIEMAKAELERLRPLVPPTPTR